jgi:hypothetical protein
MYGISNEGDTFNGETDSYLDGKQEDVYDDARPTLKRPIPGPDLEVIDVLIILNGFCHQPKGEFFHYYIGPPGLQMRWKPSGH